MAYLVDGHNLIPKVPGLSLRSLDDELELIRLLQAYSAVSRHKVEVYFDQAAAGHAGAKSFGVVRAHFVPRSQTADHAIAMRLIALKGDASNWTVVSSDRQVAAEARSHGARVVSSEQFAKDLLATSLRSGGLPPGDQVDRKNAKPGRPGKRDRQSSDEANLSDAEVEEWLRLFKSKKDNK